MNCQYTCSNKYIKTFDHARIVMAALMFYPDLIVSTFQFNVDYIEGNHIVTNVSACTSVQQTLSILQVLFDVNISRAFIILAIFWSISKVMNRANSAMFHFYAYFVAYVILQMVLHGLMIIAIAIAFHYEYLQVVVDKRIEYTISSVSWHLWYMIICGFVTPIFSIFVFFSTHYYWTQKFPLDFYLDVIIFLAERHGLENFLNVREEVRMNYTIMNKYHIQECKNIQTIYEQITFAKKIAYSFTNLINVAACLLYISSLLLFVVCFLLALPSDSPWATSAIVFFHNVWSTHKLVCSIGKCIRSHIRSSWCDTSTFCGTSSHCFGDYYITFCLIVFIIAVAISLILFYWCCCNCCDGYC